MKRTNLAPAVLSLMVLLLAGSAQAAGDFVMLQLRATDAGHALLDAQRIHMPQHAGAAVSPPDGPLIDWQLHDVQGRKLAQGSVSDPRLLRAPLEPGRGHQTVLLPEAVYVLRLPVNTAATDLRLRARGLPSSGPRIQQAAEPVTTTINIGHLMKQPPR